MDGRSEVPLHPHHNFLYLLGFCSSEGYYLLSTSGNRVRRGMDSLGNTSIIETKVALNKAYRQGESHELLIHYEMAVHCDGDYFNIPEILYNKLLYYKNS